MTCSKSRCKQRVKSNHLCEKHYLRSIRHAISGLICKQSTCKREAYSRQTGFCRKHHGRFLLHGSPDVKAKPGTKSGQSQWWNPKRETPESKRDRLLRWSWGIGLNEYESILEFQGDGCAICGRKDPGRKQAERFLIDHDHEIGVIRGLPRGLLCHPCNVALGLFGDDPEILYEAAEYVKEYRCMVERMRRNGELE